MVSELLRRALTAAPEAGRVRESSPVYGFEPFAPTGRLVTNEQVDDLRSDDAY